jgi:hypothetical protein
MKSKSNDKIIECDSDEFESLAYCERIGALRLPNVAQSKRLGKIWQVRFEAPIKENP